MLSTFPAPHAHTPSVLQLQRSERDIPPLIKLSCSFAIIYKRARVCVCYLRCVRSQFLLQIFDSRSGHSPNCNWSTRARSLLAARRAQCAISRLVTRELNVDSLSACSVSDPHPVHLILRAALLRFPIILKALQLLIMPAFNLNMKVKISEYNRIYNLRIKNLQ